MEETKIKNLYQRIAAIYADCENIPKNGFNSFQRYKYVTEADVTEHMRKLFAKHGVVLHTTIENIEMTEDKRERSTSRFYRIQVHYLLINIDIPTETLSSVFYGEASDTGDKGIYKAMTGAHKYFLMKTFCLGGDDDPENDSKDKPIKEEPRIPFVPREEDKKKPGKQESIDKKKEASAKAIMDFSAHRYTKPPKEMPEAEKDILRNAVRFHGGIVHEGVIYCAKEIPELEKFYIGIGGTVEVPDTNTFENDSVPEFNNKNI